MYENNIQAGMWSEALKSDSSLNTATSSVVEPDGNTDNRSEGASRGNGGLVTNSNGGEIKLSDNKTSRRLAQNREAARKSRLRKKAYVQQLESSRMKLTQLEQELERARKQGVFVGGSSGESNLLGSSAAVSSGVAQFEMEYGHWVEELVRRNSELRNALQAHVTDIELRILVEGCLGHYDDLYRMKAIVAKSDVFYLMSGMWRTTAERFFLWIGGYRPSEMLKVLTPQLEPLTEQQLLSVTDLQQSSQENEDALSQNLDKLLETLAETLVSVPLGASDITNCRGQMTTSMEKLDELVTFLNQADNLRQQMLRQMHQILTTRQAARGLLALGDYFQRLRALSSLWAARPRETA